MNDQSVSLHSAVRAEDRAPGTLRDLVSLTKPRLGTLVLITAGGGLWLTDHLVSTTTALSAILGVLAVVGGANALNNTIERDSDRYMARTANRPLPAGRMRLVTALVFGLALGLGALPVLALGANPLAAGLAALALVLYVLVYTPMKRVSSLSTLVGAIPGALPPLIGWTAATGSIDLGGIALFVLLFLWQIPHSLAIGMFRQDEYARAGLVVFPIEHGAEATRRQILLYTLPLTVVPLILFHLEVAGPVTLVVGSGLGLWMLWRAVDGYRHQRGAAWARGFFFGTLIHLSALFGVLAIDQVIP